MGNKFCSSKICDGILSETNILSRNNLNNSEINKYDKKTQFESLINYDNVNGNLTTRTQNKILVIPKTISNKKTDIKEKENNSFNNKFVDNYNQWNINIKENNNKNKNYNINNNVTYDDFIYKMRGSSIRKDDEEKKKKNKISENKKNNSNKKRKNEDKKQKLKFLKLKLLNNQFENNTNNFQQNYYENDSHNEIQPFNFEEKQSNNYKNLKNEIYINSDNSNKFKNNEKQIKKLDVNNLNNTNQNIIKKNSEDDKIKNNSYNNSSKQSFSKKNENNSRKKNKNIQNFDYDIIKKKLIMIIFIIMIKNITIQI